MLELWEPILEFGVHPKLNITHTCMGKLSQGSNRVASVFKILHVVEVDLKHLLTLPTG